MLGGKRTHYEWHKVSACTSKIFLGERNGQGRGKEKCGEQFNIFRAIGVSTDEVKMSAFFAELLNPKGNHEMGNAFLKAFIATIREKDTHLIDFDTDSSYANAEYLIGCKDEACENGGVIDIFLHNDKGQFIVIENKINAGDQDNQLYRYANHCETNSSGYSLVYLTKEGVAASPKSLKTIKNLEYTRISYRHGIVKWLSRCAEIATFRPRVREVIGQCIDAIKLDVLKIDELRERFADMLVSNDNINATLDIFAGAEAGDKTAEEIRKRSWDVSKRLWDRFVEQIKDIADRNNLVLDTNGIAFTESGS